ncbi:hypothetical protein V8G54_016510, partial [Vigna mungo]
WDLAVAVAGRWLWLDDGCGWKWTGLWLRLLRLAVAGTGTGLRLCCGCGWAWAGTKSDGRIKTLHPWSKNKMRHKQKKIRHSTLPYRQHYMSVSQLRSFYVWDWRICT